MVTIASPRKTVYACRASFSMGRRYIIHTSSAMPGNAVKVVKTKNHAQPSPCTSMPLK